MNRSTKSNIISFLTLGYGRWFDMTIVMLVAFAAFIYEAWFWDNKAPMWDSIDYFETWWSYFDSSYKGFRTPVYPVIIGSATSLLGMKWGSAVVLVVQKLVRFVSAYYLYKVCKHLRLGDRLSFWTISLWLLMPIVMLADYDWKILTESLAMSMMVFFAWGTLRLLRKPGVATIVVVALELLLMIFLRPGFINLIPLTALLLAYVAYRCRERKIVLAAVCSILAVGGITAGYDSYTRQKYGNSLISNIADFNALWMVYDTGLAKPEYFDDPEIRERFEVFVSEHRDMTLAEFLGFMSQVDNPYHIQARRLWHKALNEEPRQYLNGFVERLPVFLTSPIFFSEEVNQYHPRMFRYGPTAWMGIAIVGLWCFLSMRFKRDSSSVGWLTAIFMVTYLSSYIGGYGEWGRLNISVLFILFIATAQSAAWCRETLSRGNGG